jgi:hypothetical protein
MEWIRKFQIGLGWEVTLGMLLINTVTTERGRQNLKRQAPSQVCPKGFSDSLLLHS